MQILLLSTLSKAHAQSHSVVYPVPEQSSEQSTSHWILGCAKAGRFAQAPDHMSYHLCCKLFRYIMAGVCKVEQSYLLISKQV